MANKKEEQTIQINIVSALSSMANLNQFIYFSVPNEATIKAIFLTNADRLIKDVHGKKQLPQWITNLMNALITLLKKMGLLPGVSDLIILQTGRAYCMEVKTASGEQSDSQILFEQWCIDNGVPYAVVRSVDEAILQLRKWGVVG